jgi:hypothetical protein
MFMQRRSQFDKCEKWAYLAFSFLDVLSAVPPFSEGLLAVYASAIRHDLSLGKYRKKKQSHTGCVPF